MPMTNAGVRNQIQWRNKNTQHLLWSRSKNCMRHAGLCLKLNLIPTSLFVLFVSKSRKHIHWTNNFAETLQRQLLRFYSFTSRGKHKDRHYNPWVAKKHVSCYGGFGRLLGKFILKICQIIKMWKWNRTDKRVNFCGWCMEGWEGYMENVDGVSHGKQEGGNTTNYWLYH